MRHRVIGMKKPLDSRPGSNAYGGVSRLRTPIACAGRDHQERSEQVVIPAKAGIHFFGKPLRKAAPGFRRDDD
ncbi:MAG: hypothetical protein KA391_01675 [Luteimonas sp.]|nr:hypothetical protein [Luteimonas sp.]